MTSTKQISEQDCWFVIGAHQAGATERQCSELSGLSKTVTHNIIDNFKKLGSPHASKLSVNALLHNTSTNTNNKRKNNDNDQKPRKRGRPRKPIEAPFFTQNILRNALLEARTDQTTTHSSSPRLYPLDRLNTPPSDEENTNKRRDSSLMLIDELPPTPRSILAMDELSDEEVVTTGDNNWTFEDDENLLMHIFGLPMNNFKWKQVESQFGDRHMAKICAERWDFLKKQLIKDARIITKEGEGRDI